MSNDLKEIVDIVGASAVPLTTPIARDKVIEWMRSDDIEVLGAVYALMTSADHYSRIDAPILLSDSYPFIKRYLERCFVENHEGEWASSRYQAGWDTASWFARLWDDADVQRELLLDLKKWLAGLYKGGDDELRTCLVTATLEHLFERQDIAKYFADWRKDPVLKEALEQGREWVKEGGTSELTKKRM